MRHLQRKKRGSSVLAVLLLLAAGSATAGTNWYIGIDAPVAVVMPAPPLVVYPAPVYGAPVPRYPVASRVVVPVIQPPPVALHIEHGPGHYDSHSHDDDCDDD